jgi:hypothetical protein
MQNVYPTLRITDYEKSKAFICSSISDGPLSSRRREATDIQTQSERVGGQLVNRIEAFVQVRIPTLKGLERPSNGIY